MRWQDTVDMTVWDTEPDPTLESTFTPGASPDWHAWNEWAPELEVAEFCAELVRLIDPAVTIETGVSQGFITRRLIAARKQRHNEIYLFEADPDIRRQIPYVVEPDETPDEFMLSQADLLVLDSHWPQRIRELKGWVEHGKAESFVFLHDVKEHSQGGHRLMWQLVTSLNLPHMLFDNPRGSALVYRPEGWELPAGFEWPRLQRQAELRSPSENGSVFVAQIDPGTVSGAFSHSMWKMMSYSRTIPGLVHESDDGVRRHGGPRVYSSRDAVVRHFLDATDADWLLQIDSDMVFPKNLMEVLVSVADPNERPIVAGHCYMLRGESGPLPTMWAPVPDSDNMADMVHIESYPRGGLVEVAATGGACILIHRRVFESIRAADPSYRFPWYEEGFNGSDEVGEDIMFCVRARRAGHRIYVHTGLDIGHMKDTQLNYEYFDDWRKVRRFVVTGWPRSGTGYVSQLFQKAGVACRHEEVFTPKGVDWQNRWGDSSWLAVPFLRGFDGPIIQTVRHPLDVLSSLYGIGMFDEHHPNAATMAPFREFALHHTGLNPPFGADPLHTAALFLIEWHHMLNQLDVRLRIPVETVTVDQYRQLLTLARAPQPPHPTVLQRYLDAVPKDWNRPNEGRPQRFTWDEVVGRVDRVTVDRLRQVAVEWGYSL